VRKLTYYSTAYAFTFLAAAPCLAQPVQFATLNSFDQKNGQNGWATLFQGPDGNLYGTTQNGGTHQKCPSRCGVVFRITPAGKITSFSFDSKDGAGPFAGLVLGPNGNLYGTTTQGGITNEFFPEGIGTVFEIALDGTLTDLHNFSGPEGATPSAALLLGKDGNFYGTSQTGGDAGGGTFFKMTPAGAVTSLFSFDYSTYGYGPTASLVQDAHGDFYGTTLSGGAYDSGTVFKLTPRGHYTLLHSFDFTDGGSPYAGLLLAKDGNFYGSTENGGQYVGYGTIFKMTPRGKLTTLHSFDETDGDVPVGNLMQATNGKIYGTTAYGGTNNAGTVFEISPKGKLRTLHSFDGTDGAAVYSGLIQASNGLLYGTTFTGGTPSTNCPYGCGVVFSLDVGLK
jgi:uncharacterized repeat protein (TIGR03803 family)